MKDQCNQNSNRVSPIELTNNGNDNNKNNIDEQETLWSASSLIGL